MNISPAWDSNLPFFGGLVILVWILKYTHIHLYTCEQIRYKKQAKIRKPFKNLFKLNKKHILTPNGISENVLMGDYCSQCLVSHAQCLCF